MGTTRFKGENDSERLSFSEISDSDMIQLRHKPGTEEDSDKGISKASLCSCPFGVSDTSASTAVKSAVLTDSNPDFNLVSGREVVVCFTTANTASSPSLNFAGSGSIPIYYPNGSAVGSWPADTWMHLKYFSATIGNTSIQRWILLSPLPVDTVASNNMQSVTSNAVATKIDTVLGKIDTVLGNNTFEINQPALPAAQRKRNNIQEQSESIYSIDLINKNKNGLSIDINYRDSRINVHKIENNKVIETKSIFLN